jgi:hypothetical protein
VVDNSGLAVVEDDWTDEREMMSPWQTSSGTVVDRSRRQS